ncbi:hypothetical protein RYZ26_18315 [Terasakiella sp. A23]|uniref:hypothetical protein n=1 Tax=Terasakiella sp. FCG-A23 TaxID=3080561 RepID=UPI002954DDE9|nr:hypothetical protein [Terasakiella sp. A23]MDV7341565.1 hypothetical protein [Terasakiella sp. A23]
MGLNNRFVGFVRKNGKRKLDVCHETQIISDFVREIGGDLLDTVPDEQGLSSDDFQQLIDDFYDLKPVVIIPNRNHVKDLQILSLIMKHNIAVISVEDYPQEVDFRDNNFMISEALNIHRRLYSAFTKLAAQAKREGLSKRERAYHDREKALIQAHDKLLLPIIKREIEKHQITGPENLTNALEALRQKDQSLAPTFMDGAWYPKTVRAMRSRNPEIDDWLNEQKRRAKEK